MSRLSRGRRERRKNYPSLLISAAAITAAAPDLKTGSQCSLSCLSPSPRRAAPSSSWSPSSTVHDDSDRWTLKMFNASTTKSDSLPCSGIPPPIHPVRGPAAREFQTENFRPIDIRSTVGTSRALTCLCPCSRLEEKKCVINSRKGPPSFPRESMSGFEPFSV